MNSRHDWRQRQGKDRQEYHQTGWHELFGLEEAPGKKEQKDEENPGRDVKTVSERAIDQWNGEADRSDQGNLAFALYEAHHPARDKEHDINPKDRWLIHIGGKSSSRTADIQAQNFAWLAFGQDFEWTAADLAVSRESL